MSLFLGVDLTSAAKTPTAYALLDERLEIQTLDFFREDAELVGKANEHQPSLIGIDAPLSLPLGWHCLENPCSCNACLSPTLDKTRTAEVELSARRIPFYWTTRRSIIKKMVYRAISLRSALESRGHHVIEVFPYATKMRLWGRQMPKKNTPEGVTFLRQKLELLLPNLGQRWSDLDHDRADALMATYTVWLHHRGQTESLGIAAEGQIVIPREGLAPSLRVSGNIAPENQQHT